MPSMVSIRTGLSFSFYALLGILICTLPSLKADTIALPDIGASAGSMITPAEEQRLGRRFMRSVRAHLPLVDDPLLAQYIEGLGQRLLNHADRGRRQFHFFLIDQPVINAFAGPAGHIGVYSGLILSTQSESELASVVAHEISHVTQDHLVRAFENASQMSGPMMALMLAAIVLGATVSSDAGLAAAAGVQAAGVQQQINFTRENEKEADSIGIAILAEGGFDPNAMPAFFQRLSRASRLYENNAPEFLLTHPVTTNRIADATARAGAYPYRQYRDDPDYFLVRAMLREKSFNDPKQAVVHFRTTLEQGRYQDEAAQRYAYVLALLRDNQTSKARLEARKLIIKSPTYIPYVLLDARTLAAEGEQDKALRGLSAALDLFTGNYPLTRYYAELALAQKNYQGLEDHLDQALERRPDEPELYRLRSRAAAAVGKNAEAHLFLAEAYYLNDQLEKARQLLEVGLRDKQLDFYAASKLQAKLQEIKDEIKLQKEIKDKQ